MKRLMSVIGLCGLFCLSTLFAAPHATKPAKKTKKTAVPPELDLNRPAEKATASAYQPKRTTPVFKGAFSVGMVMVAFPDTRPPTLDEVKKGLFRFGDMTVTDYFKEYSQGVAWPELLVVGEESYEKAIYKAPKPLGYYCEFDFWHNPLGYQGPDMGQERVDQLRADAEKHAYRFYKRPAAPFPVQAGGKPHLTCFVYMTDLVPPEQFKEHIRPAYGDRKLSYDPTKEAWPIYKPAIKWNDALWPNSVPQVHANGGGGTVCHELGHVLGAPDFYHAPERYDGVPGTPCLSWAYGPTGPAYCRYIYNGYLSRSNYPTYTKSGTYTLGPRKTNPAGQAALGCFIPSIHPHYLYCLEYVKDEKGPLGNPGQHGLLVHVINVTLASPLLGGPDMCYTYRPGDPYFRSEGQLDKAPFGSQTGRAVFDSASDPSSRLPNLMDGGLSLTDIRETADSVTFTATITPRPIGQAEYKTSLIPKVKLNEVTEVLPTSFRAACTVTFRGEPMKSDYGFCWSRAPKPTIENNVFPLYHRDRYDARILGLKPDTTYRVRAYARNSQGISYSAEELSVKTPPLAPIAAEVPPLLTDTCAGNWVIERMHGEATDGKGNFVGSGAVVTLLKLTAYYRAPLNGEKSADDLTRIHIAPTLERPDFRMQAFYQQLGVCGGFARAAGMQTAMLTPDFERDFAKTFNLRMSGRTKPLQPFAEKDIAVFAPRIREALNEARPVVVVQESYPLSPRPHGLSWVIIDGYKGGDQFHLVYPRGKDRDFNTQSGWYGLNVLFKEVKAASILLSFAPPVR